MLVFLGVVTAIATLLSPLLAVRVSLALDKKKEARDRRFEVFRTLMLTRGTWLAPEHVRALNAIGIEFYVDEEGAERTFGTEDSTTTILAAWRAYFEHLSLPQCKTEEEAQVWVKTRVDLLVVLLREMAQYFKLPFDEDFIRNTCYVPNLYGMIEGQQAEMRLLTLELLKGQRPFPVTVAPMSLPAPDQHHATTNGTNAQIQTESPQVLSTADLKAQLEPEKRS